MLRHTNIVTYRLYAFLTLALAAIILMQMALGTAGLAIQKGAAGLPHSLDLGRLPLSFEPNAGQVAKMESRSRSALCRAHPGRHVLFLPG